MQINTTNSPARPAAVALLVASRYTLPDHGDRRVWVWGPSLCQVIAAYASRLNSRAGTEGLTGSSLICDHWLILGLETLSISCCLNHWQQICCMRWPVINCSVHTHTAKFDPRDHGARCARAVGISCQRNSGNIIAQRLSTSNPSLSPTHLSKIRGGCATTTQHTPSG